MHRIQKIQTRMKQSGIELLLIEDLPSIFYLTHLNFSLAILLLTEEESMLIVDGRYTTYAKQFSDGILCDRKDFQTIIQGRKETSLSFCQETTTFERYLELKKLVSYSPKKQLIPIVNPVIQERFIKDEQEIQILQKAAELGSLCYDHLLELLSEGVTERQLQLDLEIFARQKGASKLSFDPIIAFGTNSAKPHHHVSQKKLQPGDTVLLDLGVTWSGYQSDMTRTVFFKDVDPKMEKIYQIVYQAQNQALLMAREGITTHDLDATARSLIQQNGYGEFFSHSLGHGVGIEIHEYPSVKSSKKNEESTVLKIGSTITIEPGIYVPHIGGVRIEDTIVISKEGYRDLTQRDKNLKVIS